MPPLTRGEVSAGLVAYLEESDLRGSETVAWYQGKGSKHGPAERRPFVCFDVNDNYCKWAPFTSEPRTGSGYARLELLAEWRSGGDDACFGNPWIGKRQYLVDGANYFAGPVGAFVDASRNECSTPMTRAFVSDDGLKAIQAEVSRQQQRRMNASRGKR